MGGITYGRLPGKENSCMGGRVNKGQINLSRRNSGRIINVWEEYQIGVIHGRRNTEWE